MKRLLLAALVLLGAGVAEAKLSSLPVVTVSITDSDPANFCTGPNEPNPCCTGAGVGATCDSVLDPYDIAAAAKSAACYTAGGCILQIPSGTCLDCEITISSGTSTGRAGEGYPNGFPNGLWIRGMGVGQTILKSSIPPRNGNGIGGCPLLLINTQTNGINAPGELPRVRVSNLEMDGRMKEQPSVTIGDGAGLLWSAHKCDANFSGTGTDGRPLQHRGISWFNPAGFTAPFGQFEVYDTYIHDFGGGAVDSPTSGATNVANQGAQTILYHNVFTRFGCHNDYPHGGGTVVGEIPCGCTGTPGTGPGANCSGWEDEPNENDTYAPGLKQMGGPTILGSIPVQLGPGRRDIVAHNDISYATKYAAQWFVDVAGNWDPAVASGNMTPNLLGFGGVMLSNATSHIRGPALNCNGCLAATFDGNTYTHNYLNKQHLNVTDPGPTTGNIWFRQILQRNETITDPGGSGIRISGSNGTASEQPNSFLRVENVTITNPCANGIGDLDPGAPDSLSMEAAVKILPGSQSVWSGLTNRITNLTLKNITVTGTNNCQLALSVGNISGSSGGSATVSGLTITNGSYKKGAKTYSPTGAFDCDTAAQTACVMQATNINATGVTVNGGEWRWSTGGVNADSAGSCSGFSCPGGTVNNSSGVGLCGC